jgi:hypothetical protein
MNLIGKAITSLLVFNEETSSQKIGSRIAIATTATRHKCANCFVLKACLAFLTGSVILDFLPARHPHPRQHLPFPLLRSRMVLHTAVDNFSPFLLGRGKGG